MPYRLLVFREKDRGLSGSGMFQRRATASSTVENHFSGEVSTDVRPQQRAKLGRVSGVSDRLQRSRSSDQVFARLYEEAMRLRVIAAAEIGKKDREKRSLSKMVGSNDQEAMNKCPSWHSTRTARRSRSLHQ